MNSVSVENRELLPFAAAVGALRTATGYPWTNRRLLSTVVHRQITLHALGCDEAVPGSPVELRAAEAEALLLAFGRNGQLVEKGHITLTDRVGRFTPRRLLTIDDIRISSSGMQEIEHLWAHASKGQAPAHDLPAWMLKYFLSEREPA